MVRIRLKKDYFAEILMDLALIYNNKENYKANQDALEHNKAYNV